MQDDERAAYIAALTNELRSCEILGKAERVSAIRAELARVGAAGQAPARRAQRRVTGTSEER